MKRLRVGPPGQEDLVILDKNGIRRAASAPATSARPSVPGVTRTEIKDAPELAIWSELDETSRWQYQADDL